MTQATEGTLLLFAKIPGKAATKTRLLKGSVLNEVEVFRLSQAFFVDTLSLVVKTAASKAVLYSHPLCTSEELLDLCQQFPGAPSREELGKLELRPQSEEPFGKRLQSAVAAELSADAKPLLVIGSDSPLLSTSTLNAAFAAASAGKFVFGPTPSGGLYLIGLPADAVDKGFSLEQDFVSQTKTELQCICESAIAKGGAVSLLDLHFDVDVEEDLITLMALLEAVNAEKAVNTGKTESQNNNGLGDRALATKSVIRELGVSLQRDDADNRQMKLIRH